MRRTLSNPTDNQRPMGKRLRIARQRIPTEDELVSAGVQRPKLTHDKIVEGMRELRKRVKPDSMSVREMVMEGRPRESGGKPPARRSKRPMRVEDHAAFGMWADREDMKDVHAWLRRIRTPRYLRDGGALFSRTLEGRRTRVRVDAKGRFAIPASFRAALDMRVGDEIELHIEENELRISTLQTRLPHAQKRPPRLIKPGRRLSEELIAERRKLAKSE